MKKRSKMHRGNSCILNEALSYQYSFILIRIRMTIWMEKRWIIEIRSNWNFSNFPNRNIFFEKKKWIFNWRPYYTCFSVFFIFLKKKNQMNIMALQICGIILNWTDFRYIQSLAINTHSLTHVICTGAQFSFSNARNFTL